MLFQLFCRWLSDHLPDMEFSFCSWMQFCTLLFPLRVRECFIPVSCAFVEWMLFQLLKWNFPFVLRCSLGLSVLHIAEYLGWGQCYKGVVYPRLLFLCCVNVISSFVQVAFLPCFYYGNFLLFLYVLHFGVSTQVGVVLQDSALFWAAGMYAFYLLFI